tara:strand:- start:2256 stop:3473 length:1218 start_codon:yes stop_codon:yes gene_type:complete
MNNTTEMKPKYVMNVALKEYKIIYGNRTYLFNSELYCKIFNYDKGFKFYNIDDDYPAYKINEKYFNLLDFAYGVKKEDFNFKFVNGNKYDLRDENVILENIAFETALNGVNIIKHIYKGTPVDEGRYSREIKNPICEILNEKNEVEYLMLCNQGKLCRICPLSYQAIRDFEKKHNYEKPIIWSYCTTGYIQCSSKSLSIHQVIKDCYGNGKGTKEISVDHIDRNPLNNRVDNLRIATQEEQQQNSKGTTEGTKRERKHNAKELPEGITHDMMKKYVVYYKECYNKDKDLWREFFKVEKHPKIDKPITSSKSGKISILDKLNQINQIAADLENDTYEKAETGLPISVHKGFNKAREDHYLCYETKIDGKRTSVRMKIPDDYDLPKELAKLEKKIQAKNTEYIHIYE